MPPPPGPAETRHELKALAELIGQNDATAQQQIAFWDAGAPSYRWIDLINQRAVAGQSLTPFAQRVYAYVAIAMNDATIAAWESKYYYNRARPSELDHKLATAVAVPNSPSYPSEHAATAWAAATVLAHLLPAEASAFLAMAEEAGNSRVLAGLQFPSDVDAGAELGRRVAAAVIAKADLDGSADTPTGTRLTGDCKWVGTNPGNFGAQNWHPMLLTSPDQFRPPLPPDCHSAQVTQEVADVRNFPRSPAAFATNYKAFYWQSPEGLNTWVYPIRGQVDVRGRRSSEPAARRARVCAHRRDAVRCVHREPGREVYVLVSQAAPARSGDRAALPGAQLPELPVESLDVLGEPFRDTRLPVPDARCPCSGYRQGSRRLENLGGDSLPDGQRRRSESRPFGRRRLHRAGAAGRLAVAHTEGRHRFAVCPKW